MGQQAFRRGTQGLGVLPHPMGEGADPNPRFLELFGVADVVPKINAWGGAIAMGHPLASSGVRLMNQLARHFEDNPKVRYGMTTMCIGLGMGGTVIWENSNYKG